MVLVKIASLDDMKDGEASVVEADGKAIALFRVAGKFYATQNDCLHRGGPLGEGTLDGEVVTCPWHGWEYNVKTGVSPVDATVVVKTFPVIVKDNYVYVEV